MTQQRKTLKISQRLHQIYGNDPVGFINEHINFTGLKLDNLSYQQEEIASALTAHKNICISAGGGIGKTALAALLIIWFLATHPNSKIPTTAPSGKQLNDVLWSELGIWLKRCSLEKMFVLRKGKLHIKGFPEWYAVARTVPRDGKDLNDTLAGFHAQHLMILVDEASGVPDPVFTALEGAMTDQNTYVFLISNPVSSGGYYYDTIYDPDGKGKDYKVLYYDSRESPLVDSSYEERIIARYGKNSPMYKSKVMGLPIADVDTVVVSPELFDKVIQTNREHQNGPVILSIDVAGEGEDSTVYCHRRGNSIIRWDEYSTNEPGFIVNEAIRLQRTLYSSDPFCCVIDAGGLGWGVYHELRNSAKFNVIGFIGGEKAFHDAMYKNKRTEGYHRLQKEFPHLHFPILPPERMKKELANIRFDFQSEPIQMFGDKKALRKRLGFSPDYSDALMMNLAIDNFMATTTNPNIGKRAKKRLHVLKKSQHAQKFGKFQKFIT